MKQEYCRLVWEGQSTFLLERFKLEHILWVLNVDNYQESCILFIVWVIKGKNFIIFFTRARHAGHYFTKIYIVQFVLSRPQSILGMRH